MYKLLIVENDAVIANSIRAHMQSWGYEAVCVEDFREVQKTFLAEQPQLVLMDISLPFYNGYHWWSLWFGCRKIR